MRVNNRLKFVHWVQEIDGNISCGYGPLPPGATEMESAAAAEDAHPELKEARERREQLGQPLQEQDDLAPIDIPVARLIKAQEARAVLFDGVRDEAQLPYLTAALQPGQAVRQLAKIVWQKHIECAEAEGQRVKQKAVIRAGGNVT